MSLTMLADDEKSKNRVRVENENREKIAISTNEEKIKKFETSIRRRVDCEKNAFDIVNKLIDGTVESEYLMDCGKFISSENYKDIVEERAISYLCGYPLCDGELKNIPKKKYHISTKSNKVYDITERKNFCSNQCLEASKSFEKQIPDSPVWARVHEPTPVFALLPHKSTKGIMGTEVVVTPLWKSLAHEVESLKELDSTKPTSAEKEELRQRNTKLSYYNESPSQQTKVSSQREGDSSDIICDLEKLNIREEGEKTERDVDPNSSVCGYEPAEVCMTSRKTKIIENVTDSSKELNACDRNLGKENVKDNISPLERLNLLLAKKKNALSGMADIQEVTSSSKTFKSDTSLTSGTIHNSQSKPLNTNNILEMDSVRNISKANKENPSKDNVSPTSVPLNSVPENSYTQRTSVCHSSTTISCQPPVQQSPIGRICCMIQPWVTDNTYKYLKELPLSGSEDVNVSGFSHPKIQSGYMELCKRLDFQDKGLEEGLGELADYKTEESPSKRQSVPDYQLLKDESDKFQLKVTEFITGKKVKETSKNKKDTEDEDPVFLPTVDIYNQSMIRAKIVLERLDKTVPDLLVPLRLSAQDVSTCLRELIYTFRLERDNIIFKPAEWTLVALVLLKMLAMKVKLINSAFKRDTAISYLKILLKGIGQTDQDLHNGVVYLLQDNI